MRIIGCDLHARQQTLAMLDTATGEVVDGDSDARRRQRAGVLFHASRSGARRDRSDGVDEVVFAPDGRTGNRLSGRSSGDDSSGRTARQKHDRRDAELLLKLLVENRFPSIWQPSKELLDLRGVAATPSSVGTHADADTECAAGDRAGEWFTTRHFAVEPRRTKQRSRRYRWQHIPLIDAVSCRRCTRSSKRRSNN